MRRPSTPRTGRLAFTLLEVMAALALTGLVLIGCWRLLAQLADSRDRIGVEFQSAARRANGVRVIRALLERAETSFDSTRQPAGAKAEVRFHSWCDVPSGWLERCDVTLSVD